MNPEHKIFVGNIPGTPQKKKYKKESDPYFLMFQWEEVYNNGESKANYFEATYRAKVFGGWLIRHETCSDYQYGCNDNCEDNPLHRHIDDEGWQNVSNTLTVIPDKHHKWKIE